MNEYTPELSVVGIVGFLVPFVVSLINRPSMKSSTRRWVSVVVSIVLAVVALLAVGGFTDVRVESPQQIIVVILGVLGVAQFVYTALQSAIPSVLPAVEVATSPHSSRIEPGHSMNISYTPAESAVDQYAEDELSVSGLERSPDYIPKHLKE